MEVLLGVLAGVLLLLWLLSRVSKPKGAGVATPNEVLPEPVHVRGERVRLSGDGRISVVGESHYQPALRSAAHGVESGEGFDEAITAEAVLVPERTNQYDPQAVRVDINGRTVGYLARELAALYQPPLLELQLRGQVGWCRAGLMGGGGRYYGAFLHLGHHDRLLPANSPDGLEVLVADRPVTVTGEERHQDVLASFNPDGVFRGVPVFAALEPSPISRGKYAGEVGIEVKINGERVGELTKAMSDRYLPLVLAAVESGRVPGCEALVTESEKGRQVELRMPKA